jgi:hypothetical protein
VTASGDQLRRQVLVGANAGPRKRRHRFGNELGRRFLLVEFCRSRAQAVEAATPGGAVGSDLLQRGDHVGHEAQLKVRQHDAAVFTEQNVLRFQIPVTQHRERANTPRLPRPRRRRI